MFRQSPRSGRASSCFAVLVALTTIAHASPSLAQTNDALADVWFGSNFDDTNGDKIIVGRMNTLHAVFETAGQVYHVMSVNGINWEEPSLIGGYSGARQPTIASDSDGTLVVAAIMHPDEDGFGQLSVARLAWGDDEWWMAHLNEHASEPDIAARGGTTYVTWTNGVEALYEEFETLDPPLGGVDGEIVQAFPCEGVRVSKPSLALARHGCERTVYLGYLLEFDGIEFPCTTCWQDFNWISPWVQSRVEGGGWTSEFSDPSSVWFPTEDAESVSLSMNANYLSGDVFLAWSDVNNGVERTKIAHTDGGPWSQAEVSNEARKIHIAAGRRFGQSDFRIASVVRGPFQPEFFAPGATYRTGSWTGTAPDWSPDSDLIDATFGNQAIFHPQAVIWSRCTNPVYTEVKAIGQFNEGPHYELMTYRESVNGCPDVPPGYGILCPEDFEVKLFGTPTPAGKLLDVSALGTPLRTTADSATFRVGSSSGDADVRVRWTRGTLRSSTDGLLLIDDVSASVSLQSSGPQVRYAELPRHEAFWNPGVRY